MIRVTIAPRVQNARVMNGVTRYLLGILAHGDPNSLDIDLRVLHQGREMPASEWLNRYPALKPSSPWAQKLDRTLLRPLALYRSRASVIHFPLSWLPQGWTLGSAAKVITIHGASRLTGAWHSVESRDLGIAFRRQLQSNLTGLARVITGSQWSRKDLSEAYDISPTLIEVIPYGIDQTKFHPLDRSDIQTWQQETLGKMGPYLLYVGPCSPRKNTLRLVQAFGHLKQRHYIPHRLVMVSAPNRYSGTIKDEIQRLNLTDDVAFVSSVEDETLVKLYNGAQAFVFPSLYEGFGLPVLEAMACGTPVITSNRTALPEIAGDAAVLIDDPTDTESIAFTIEQVLENTSHQETLRQRGLARAQFFTWEACAAAHLELYRQVARKPEG